MTLADIMARDLAGPLAVDFGETATVTPIDGESTFSITVITGDHQPSPLEVESFGLVNQITLQASCSLAAYRAGCLAVFGTARDAIREDKLVIASGANAGTWYVLSGQPDVGDCLVLNLRKEDPLNVGSTNAMRIR
jgi:hypothetical protein